MDTLRNKPQSEELDENFSCLSRIDYSFDRNYKQVLRPPRPKLTDMLLQMVREGSKWDVQIYVGEYKFYCHLFVLQAYSSYFRRCKVEETFIVRLSAKRVTPQAFNIIYKWMLHDQVPKGKRINNRCLLEIYSTAKYLNIQEIVDTIWNTLDKLKNENEVFSLLPDMSLMDMETFEFLCFSRVSRFFLTLAASMEYVELDLHFVCHLLTNHSLGVNSEAEVFYSALRWLTHRWPERQGCIIDVIRCVRFGLLPPAFLRFLQGPQQTRVMQCICSCEEVKEMVRKAFIYVTAELYCKDPKVQISFELPEYDIPEQRRWLFDPQCPYHHDLKCSQRQFVTYDQFLDYLQLLHETGPDYWRKLNYLLEPTECCSKRD